MKQEYIIRDASIKYMETKNPLDESIFYHAELQWVKGFKNATTFTEVASAVTVARELQKELPVKLLQIQTEDNKIGVGEVTF